jgi:hypothetical protein
VTSRCIVLVPYLDRIEPECERALDALERSGLEVRRIASSAAIDLKRSTAATAALADGADELMWIDADIAFEPEAVTALRAHALPLVAGVAAKKGVQDLAVRVEPGTTELRVGAAGGLCRVRHAGTGFMLTRRQVYEDIRRVFSLPICNLRHERAVPYFLPMVIAEDGEHVYLSEDYAFCERARLAGHTIMVDTTIRLGHVGRYVYQWEDAGEARPQVASATFKLRPDD